MAQKKTGTTLELNGSLKGLTIKVNGVELVFETKGKKKPSVSESEAEGRRRLMLVSKFASSINKVPSLHYLWWRVGFLKTNRAGRGKQMDDQNKPGKARAFNKIVSANGREKIFDWRPHPGNRIVPKGNFQIHSYKAELSIEGINIEIYKPKVVNNFPEEPGPVTAVVVLCPYDPIEENKVKFETISKSIEIEGISPDYDSKIFIPIEEADRLILMKYKSCIFFPVIIELPIDKKTSRYFDSRGVEFSLSDYPETPVEFGEYKDAKEPAVI
jgi:hypothetical protein